MFDFKVRAPEFSEFNISYINTQKFSLSDLKGNIVLLDFWTYCCINCIHITHELSYLEDKFKDESLQVIGIHTYKYDNENDPDNVKSAIQRYEIHHAVILDQERRVWDSFAVRAWPTLALIDSEGYVRKVYQGEGHKLEIEKDIMHLLSEGKKKKSLLQKFPIEFTFTPEKPFLYYPGKISIEGNRVAIANSNNNNIVIGTIDNNTIHVDMIIGAGEIGHNDGDFVSATFYRPQGVLLNGSIAYVADTENNMLRKIDFEKKYVSTIETSFISSPWDLALHNSDLYIALAGSHQLGVYHIDSQKYEVFAGNRYENIADGPNLQASLAQPSGLSISEDILFFADSETSAIRYIKLQKPYYVRTISGQGLFEFGLQDGEAQYALFQHPLGLAAKDHIVYIADTYNSAIRKISMIEGKVSTLIASMANEVCRIDDKECNVLSLDEPTDVKIWNNSLIISDTNNHLIRRFDLNTKELITLDIIQA